MATPTTTLHDDHAETGGPHPAAARVPSRRLALIRMLAATHLLSATLLALSVAGNLALGLNYTGGPMGYFGAQSVGLAGFLNNAAHLGAWDATQFWAKYNNYSFRLYRHAQASPTFFGSMASVHFAFAGLCAGIGYGLWRRRAWARMADLALVGTSAASATAHGVILVVFWSGHSAPGLQALVVTTFVAGPILLLLLSPRTAILFGPSTSPETDLARERRWWTLSFQWLLAVLVGVFAFGIVWLLCLGPIVEFVWAVALWSRDGIGF